MRVPIADVKTASARDLNFVTMPISPYHVQSSVSDDSTVNLHLQSFKTLRQSDSTLQLNVVISYPSTSDADAGTSFMGRVTNLARQLSISGAVTPSHEIFTSANCDNSAVSRVAATVELSRVDFIVAHGTQAAAATTDMSTSGSRPSGNGKAPSTSSTAVPMPNIIGQTRNAAVARLRELGIQRIVFNDTSNSAANNIVAMAKPVPGTLVRPGGLVSLTTTTNKQLAFPNWIGQPSSVAQQVASYSGFVMVVDTILVDSLSRNYSDLIGSQRPAAGSRARVGDTIRVTVDVLRIKVPPLTGLDLQTALKQLSAVGLTARVDTTRVSASRMPLGSVLKQSPVSGTRVRKQSEVQLTIILAAETNGANSNSPGNTVYSDSVFAKHALDVVVQKYPASDLQNAIQALQKNTPRTTWLADLVESASKSYGVTPTQMRDLVQLTLCRTPTSDEAAAFAGELAKVGPKAFVQSRLNSPEGLRVRASCIDGRGASAK
ncbi:MAG: PASTA domain-containing protein [Gemmatimonadaceae bacterium]